MYKSIAIGRDFCPYEHSMNSECFLAALDTMYVCLYQHHLTILAQNIL